MNLSATGVTAWVIVCSVALHSFAATAAPAEEKVLHSFGGATDGKSPNANLIDVKGTLYGTTVKGGINGLGTVFSLDPKTGAETVLHSFGGSTDGSGPTASLIDVKGTFYGTTVVGGTYRWGTVFSLNPNTGAESVLYSFCSQQNCTDGGAPTPI